MSAESPPSVAMALAQQPEEAGKRRRNPSSPFNKGTLVPVWIIQGVVLLLYIGVLSWQASHALGQYLVEDVVILVLCAICLLLDVAEMILFRTKRLKPLLFLNFQVVKVALWLIVLAVCLSVIMRQKTRDHWSVFSVEGVFAGGLIEVVIILLAFLASLALGSIIYHRHHKASRNTLPRPTPDTYRKQTSTEEQASTEEGPPPLHYSIPEVVHPAYRGSTYKGPTSRHVNALTLTDGLEHAGPCYEGEGTARPLVELGVSKGKAPSTGSRGGSVGEVFEMGSNRSFRRDS